MANGSEATEKDRQGCRNANSNNGATGPNSPTENKKKVGGSGDERESGYDSINPLRDVNATELRAHTLIMRAGANRCNMGYENVRIRESGDEGKEQDKERERGKVVERGHIPAEGPRENEYGRG